MLLGSVQSGSYGRAGAGYGDLNIDTFIDLAIASLVGTAGTATTESAVHAG